MTFLSSRGTFIYNPNAGFWDWGAVVQRVVRFWEERGWTIEVQSTSGSGHATQLARAAAAAGAGLVFAVGGDGTLNEVANGLVHTQTVLAPLPVGTANSFAKELELPRPNLLHPTWLLEVSAALSRGSVRRMDVGKSGDGRYWLLWAGSGIDGFVVKQLEPRSRWFKRLGPIAYLAKALFFLPQFRGAHACITVDDCTFEGDFLLITAANCRMFAGGELRLNTGAVLDDGAFEVWLFHGRNWPRVLSYSLDISRESHWYKPGVDVVRGRYIAVQTSPAMPFHLDGEPAGATPFACAMQPRALRILTPDTMPDDLFGEPGEAMRI